jgi:DNA ligase D-like protein (predicted 3'-phosphoesterase)
MPSLDEYRKKRDFAKTAEPEGETRESGQSRFVVQKHQARTLHYDFRLEHGGVLVSWAVPKGPPEVTSQRRLAIQTEDHPIDYIDFEGEIAEGEYGAGTVEVWDQGHYDLLLWTDKQVKITLHGQRLEGNYVLIHTDASRWLFIKEREG